MRVGWGTVCDDRSADGREEPGRDAKPGDGLAGAGHIFGREVNAGCESRRFSVCGVRQVLFGNANGDAEELQAGRNVQLRAMEGFRRTRSSTRQFLLVALFLLPLQVALSESVNSLPKPNDYVNDYAHVLSPDTVAKLDRICAELDHSQANAQVAVVTVRNLDGLDAADWANQLEDKWKMGKKGSDRGVLVLLAVDDRKYRIDVGYGLEGILNDAKWATSGARWFRHCGSRITIRQFLER